MSLCPTEFDSADKDLPDFTGAQVEAEHLPPVRERIQALLLDCDVIDSISMSQIAGRSKQLEIALTLCYSIEQAKVALSERRFDVIFLEYWLGEETTVSFIHNVAATAGAPCIVLTDLDEPDIRRIAFRAGAHAFLSKQSLCPQALESVTLAVLRPQLSATMAAA